jgi:hypothetical protein
MSRQHRPVESTSRHSSCRQLDARWVPNGPTDTATFGLSNTTDVSISANTEVNGITFTSAATNPYIITVNPHVTLTLGGTGIMNSSGRAQIGHITR